MWLIEPIDHWVAFILLAIIGGNMIREALGEEEEEEVGEFERLDLKEVLLLAVATSIDARSVGVAFASLKVNIWLSVALIGVTTFCFSVAGVAIGCAFGSRFERPAQITGGVILILIGLKVLIEDLGFFPF
jgi:putative Mn2+ efflux pump MntP